MGYTRANSVDGIGAAIARCHTYMALGLFRVRLAVGGYLLAFERSGANCGKAGHDLSGICEEFVYVSNTYNIEILFLHSW